LKTADSLNSGSRPPPLTARKRTAGSQLPTAKNSRTVSTSSVAYSSVAVLFRAIKGKPLCGGWVIDLWLGI